MTDIAAATKNDDWDNTQAEDEGWAIFTANTGPEFQIQRDDEQGIFEEDEDAWKFVAEQANAGSAYHQQALLFLGANAPEELALIRDKFALTFEGAPDAASAPEPQP